MIRAAWLTFACLVGCAPADFHGIDAAYAHQNQAQFEPASRFDFSGIYDSPQSGRVSLWQRGESLQGSYWLADCERPIRGQLTGTVRGNLARVTWIETQNVAGVPKQYTSDGYFYFSPGQSPQLLGEQTYFTAQPGRRGAGAIRIEHRNVWTATQTGPVVQFPSINSIDCTAEEKP